MTHHWDRKGRRITRQQWEFLQDDHGYVEVATSYVGPPGDAQEFLVSTVWTGLSYQPAGPQLFETLGVHRTSEDATQYRVPTETEAQRAHAAMISFLVGKITADDGAATVTHVPPRVSLIKGRR